MREIGYRKCFALLYSRNLGTMHDWMGGIGPDTVSIGYDNYSCGLPEPPKGLTERLGRELERSAEIERKQSGNGTRRVDDWFGHHHPENANWVPCLSC